MPRTHRKRGLGRHVGDRRAARGLRRRSRSRPRRTAPGPADLVPVEAVRRRERQVRSIPIEQVERGDVRVERVAGPVDDRLEQLVPGPRRRREAGDLVEEAELLELIRLAGPRLGRVPVRSSGPRYKRRGRTAVGRLRARVRGMRNGDRLSRLERRDGRVTTREPERGRPRRAARRSAPLGRRDPLAREVRLLGSLLGQVIVEQAGPTCSSSSSGSAGRRSGSAGAKTSAEREALGATLAGARPRRGPRS